MPPFTLFKAQIKFRPICNVFLHAIQSKNQIWPNKQFPPLTLFKAPIKFGPMSNAPFKLAIQSTNQIWPNKQWLPSR